MSTISGLTGKLAERYNTFKHNIVTTLDVLKNQEKGSQDYFNSMRGDIFQWLATLDEINGEIADIYRADETDEMLS